MNTSEKQPRNKKRQALPELLAPCGSPAALDAAIKGGADAVYLGGTFLNARMNAKNFTDEQMKAAFAACHDKGVLAYVTMNTAVFDRELDSAVRYASFLYEAGADAFIITDLGLAAMIRKYIPGMPLHGSTQISGHNAAAAAKLFEAGFSRMVVARELDCESIGATVQNSPIEIEIFIHGALCVSHSGQCLMSSVIGGRSGNRGECAQPCRMRYGNAYPLSLKDLCLAGHVTELLSLGVTSLKIEGRMKSPDYVYGVTNIYRRLLDEKRNASPEEIQHLAALFSRSGFTDGYFTKKIGQDMLGVRTDDDKAATGTIKGNYREYPYQRGETIPQTPGNQPISLPAKIMPEKQIQPQKNLRTARFETPGQITAKAREYFDIIYLPLDRYDLKYADGVILPPVIFDTEQIKIPQAGHIMVGNLGHITLAQNTKATLHGDFRLNITNSGAAAYYAEIFEDVILSPELTLPQIRDIGVRKSVIVYGKIPIMTLERPLNRNSLTDRTGAVFSVLQNGRRDIVLNSVPFYMADKQKELANAHIKNQHFIFTTETKSEIDAVIAAYQAQKLATGLYKRIGGGGARVTMGAKVAPKPPPYK